jgi:prepilin-type N-terminal cleavage/methylation domain-containing protein
LNKDASNSSGFTLFEIIIAIFILSIAVVPMMESFGPAIMSAASVEKTAVITNQARATMDRMLVMEFDTLKSKIGTSLSGNDVFGDTDETFPFEGDTYSPDITISDASGDSSRTLLELIVSIDNISFSTLKADY